MNISNTQSKVDLEDKPLTRADVERLLQGAGSSDKLKLNSRNLKGIELANFDLSQADLTGANLNDANLTRANLTGANPTGANLTDALQLHIFGEM